MNKTFKISTFSTSFLSAVILVLSAVSCSKDEDVPLIIEEPLVEYFNRFAAEGALRNVTVDYTASRVSAFIKEIGSQTVIGQCMHDEKKPNTVILDRTYWNHASDLQKEFLVFHELGHCVLNREHLDIADTHGNCMSIMTSGTAFCKINYNQNTREQLLDELFIQ